MMNEKIMIFIDGANIMKSARRMKIKIDYLKLTDKLKDGRKLIRTYFFDAVPEPLPAPKGAFMDFLRHNGVTVITKELKYRKISCQNCLLAQELKRGNDSLQLPNINKNKEPIILKQEYQKGVDVALATELLKMAREDVYDTAVVVSGDNDYTSAVECVKNMGKRVEVASFRDSLGRDIKQMADKLVSLDNMIAEIAQPDAFKSKHQESVKLK